MSSAVYEPQPHSASPVFAGKAPLLDSSQVAQVSRNNRKRKAAIPTGAHFRRRTFVLNTNWNAWLCGDVMVFPEFYHIPGIVTTDSAVGWDVALHYARNRGEEHTFFIRLTDGENRRYFASFLSYEHFLQSNWFDPVPYSIGNASIPVEIECRETEFSNEYDTGISSIRVDPDTRWLLNASCSEFTFDFQKQQVVDCWAIGMSISPSALTGAIESFSAEQVIPASGVPVQLFAFIPFSGTDYDHQKFRSDFYRFLARAFHEASDQMDGIGPFDVSQVTLEWLSSSGRYLFAYKSIWFREVEDLRKFWSFVSHYALSFWDEKTSYVFTITEHENRYSQAFLVNVRQFQGDFTVGLPIERGSSNLIVVSKAVTAYPLVRFEGVERYAGVDSFTLGDVATACNMGPQPLSECLQATDFRILLAGPQMALSSKAFLECPYVSGGRKSWGDNHKYRIVLTPKREVFLACSCRVPPESALDEMSESELNDELSQHVLLGELDALSDREPLTLSSSLPDCRDYELSSTDIMFGYVNGIVKFLTVVLKGRLVYSNDDWYIWSGRLWIRDKKPKGAKQSAWLTSFLSHSLAQWVDRERAYISADEKAALKVANDLHRKFVQNQMIGPIITQLTTTLADPTFESRQRHLGYIAANNGMVNLRTGELRPFTSGHAVVETCDYEFFPCSCGGKCFEKGHTGCSVNKPVYERMKRIDNIIREIMGCSYRETCWITDDKTVTEGPRFSVFKKRDCFWRNREGVERDEPFEGAEKITRATRYIFERDGQANYDRFRWTLGYILMGYADKKLFVYGYGDQNNGKTLLWSNLMDIFSPYLGEMHPSIIFSQAGRHTDNATPALVHIFTKRGGVVSDTSEKDRLNDGAVKKWTGRDKQVGRYMRGEFFDMHPSLVPIVNGNHQLDSLNIMDGALMDRFHLLYYPITFVRRNQAELQPHQRYRDDTLVWELEASENREALMNWAIRCCLYYVQTPKCPMPDAVLQQFNMIRDVNNPIKSFVDQSAEFFFDKNESVPFKEFHRSLKAWAMTNSVNFRFKEPAKFRNLLRELQGCGESEYELKLTGTGRNETIKGIGQDVPIIE